MIYVILGAAILAIAGAVLGTSFVVRRIFSVLPKPETFAEGQRLVFGWLASGAGIFCGLMAEQMIALFMWGGWSKAEEHTIVVILGWALGGFIAAMIVVVIGLLVGGPVGRFKGSVSNTGLTFDAENTTDASAPQAVATVTASVATQGDHP